MWLTGTFAPFMLNGVLTSGVSHICNTVLASGQPLISTYPGTTTQYVVPTRLNPLWGDSELAATNADSNYNGAQLALTKRVSFGLEAQVAYTFSRVIDDSQGQYSQSDLGDREGCPNKSCNRKEKILIVAAPTTFRSNYRLASCITFKDEYGRHSGSASF